MRILRNAYLIGQIAGFRAFWRTLRRGWRVALASQLDELSSLILLLRERVLRKNAKLYKDKKNPERL